jgi:hypothetical protein
MGGGPSSWGLGAGLTTPQWKTSSLLRIMIENLRPGRILWHEPSTEKWILDSALGCGGKYLDR